MDGKLVIDVREACNTERSGKGQWTFGLVSELLQRKLSITLMTDTDVPEVWMRSGCTIEKIDVQGWRWHSNVLRWLTINSGATYLSPTSYIVPAFAPKSIRCIPVVHDLIAFRGEPHDRKATWIERWTLPRAVRRSSMICVTSNATKCDLLERYPDLPSGRVKPIFAGPSHPHPELSTPDGKTILCIATLCPRKNQLRLIEAYAQLPDGLRSQYRLVLAGGRGWHDQPILDAVARTQGVEYRGYVTASTYMELLKTCTVFALPSLYEGFGMQILDAMQRGIPVLTSNRGSLHELAEGAALIVNPENVSSISDGLSKLLTDEMLRNRLRTDERDRANVYSWRRTADLLLACL